MNGMIVATKGWIQSKGIEVASRGILSTWRIRVVRAEIVELVSKFHRTVERSSIFHRNG